MGNEIELSSVITDIAAGPFGSNLRVECFVPYGFPIIDGANLKGYKVTDNLTKFVTEEKARSLSRSIAHRGDVVVTISGTLGQIAYIPEDSMFEEYLCSQRQFRVSFDKSKVYVPYLVFYFHTFEGQNKILSFASQTGVPALSQPLKNFKKIRLCLPEYPTQKKIASIIEAFNDKIECNQKINDNLAVLLQTVYQERFGDVDKAVEQGVLSDICSYSKDRVAVSELDVSTYFSTENMLPRKAGSTEATSLPTTPQTTACHKGDTLISNIRPYFKKIVYCEDECGCSTDVLCFMPNQPQYSAYLFSTLYADKFFAFMVAGAKGTKMPRGDKQRIMTYPIVLPSEVALAEFNIIALPLIKQIYSNRAENKRLSLLRDTLLPKLMSGELDVSDIDL